MTWAWSRCGLALLAACSRFGAEGAASSTGDADGGSGDIDGAPLSTIDGGIDAAPSIEEGVTVPSPSYMRADALSDAEVLVAGPAGVTRFPKDGVPVQVTLAPTTAVAASTEGIITCSSTADDSSKSLLLFRTAAAATLANLDTNITGVSPRLSDHSARRLVADEVAVYSLSSDDPSVSRTFRTAVRPKRSRRDSRAHAGSRWTRSTCTGRSTRATSSAGARSSA